ncbi:MAG: polysaccharide biosynthesis tyrosine autokinase [Opitutales bacterium]|jgi:capsular exopolysaccharide synthesis family protein
MANSSSNKDGGQHSYGGDGSNYDNRYGSYYYGENNYGGYYGEGHTGRGIGDYVAMFRERIWWLFISLFVCIVAMGFFCMNATPVYTAWSSLQIFRQQNKTVEFNEVSDSSVRNDADFNTEVSILEGVTIAQNVERRLKESERRELMSPFLSVRSFDGQTSTPLQVLMDNRSILPRRMTLMINIQFSHPNRDLAARIANIFAEEYIAYKRSKNVEVAMRAVDELQGQIDVQGRKVNDLELQMANMKEKYKTISFDAGTDINQQELMRVTEYATQDKRILDEVRSVWELVEKAKAAGRDLWEVPDIARDQRVPPLLMRRTEVNIEKARLSESYKEKHPKMIEVTRQSEEIEKALNATVDSVVEGLRNQLANAESNYASALQQIAKKQDERIQLEKLRPEYERLKRDLDGARNHYDYLYSRKQQTMAMSGDDSESARIVDQAIPPIKPSSPRVLLDMILSVFLGSCVGVSIIFLFIVLDDKIKSAFDIERSLSLNIIGVIPRIPKSMPQARARIVSSGNHQPTLEAFRSIHSSLQLNDEAKNSKVFLVTSTIPSEGKSFVATNIALTYAARGERVLVIDGDFRMPNIAKSLDLDNSKGFMTVLADECKLDEAIQTDVEKHFDVLPTGGSTNNPPHILCSSGFEEILHELRLRYDRIFIDSPPLAPVSDALNLLSNVDGVIYVIRFNTVKRKTAATCLKRLRESNVPVLGAVMNNITGNQTAYYYSHYYDRTYSNYYVSHKVTAVPTSGNGVATNGMAAKGPIKKKPVA